METAPSGGARRITAGRAPRPYPLMPTEAMPPISLFWARRETAGTYSLSMPVVTPLMTRLEASEKTIRIGTTERTMPTYCAP